MRVTVPLHPAKRYHWKHVTTARRARSEEAGELSLKDFLLTCSLTHTHTHTVNVLYSYSECVCQKATISLCFSSAFFL